MAQHNLGTVIGFEFFRTIKKKSFWLGTLAVPLMIVVVFGLIFLSSKSTSDTSEKQKEAKFSFVYTDKSKLLNQDIMKATKAKTIENKGEGVKLAREGRVDAYFFYPQNPTKEAIEVYGKDEGIFNSGKYEAVAKQLLSLSVEQQVSNGEVTKIIKDQLPSTKTVLYKDGKESGGFDALIPPMIFLVAFYLLIVLLGNQMLNSTVEEKENRVTEMILTTLNPTTLIIGKIISNFMAGVVQLIIFALPVLVGYFGFRNQLNMPNIDLSQLTFDPQAMIVGALLLITGFMVFTGALVAIGAVMPTAKEAGQYFGICMIAIFIPFYIISLIISDPHAWLVQVFTFFPLSAPVTAMIRNAFGSLSLGEAIIVISELFVVGVIVIGFAVRLFRYGSMEYSNRLSLKTLFNKS